MRKTQVKMNKPVYIGFSILELIKFKCNSYGMIILKKNIIKKVSFVLRYRFLYDAYQDRRFL